MKKSRFLQLGFGVAVDTCNSMYFYILSANRQVAIVVRVTPDTPISYTYDAIHMQLCATYLHHVSMSNSL
jgi:hypothetical protein